MRTIFAAYRVSDLDGSLVFYAAFRYRERGQVAFDDGAGLASTSMNNHDVPPPGKQSMTDVDATQPEVRSPNIGLRVRPSRDGDIQRLACLGLPRTSAAHR
jgi:hypothetical protein